MADATQTVASRPRGRPKSPEPRTPVTTWVKPSEYERLRKLARANDQSVSSLVSSLLKLRIGR